jgi:hypothetical protein
MIIFSANWYLKGGFPAINQKTTTSKEGFCKLNKF